MKIGHFPPVISYNARNGVSILTLLQDNAYHRGVHQPFCVSRPISQFYLLSAEEDNRVCWLSDRGHFENCRAVSRRQLWGQWGQRGDHN